MMQSTVQIDLKLNINLVSAVGYQTGHNKIVAKIQKQQGYRLFCFEPLSLPLILNVSWIRLLENHTDYYSAKIIKLKFK